MKPIADARSSANVCWRAFTLVELLVVVAVISVVLAFAVPAITSLTRARGVDRAVAEVASLLELARAEAMATRSYVYVGFANAINSDHNSEIHVAALISMDGSSNIATANLRALSKVSRIANVSLTDYSTLPAVVRAAADISLSTNANYVVNFPTTTYFATTFSSDPALADCPTVTFSPQGDVLDATNPAVFFRTTTSVGFVAMSGTTALANDGAIISYYGGTGQVRTTRPH